MRIYQMDVLLHMYVHSVRSARGTFANYKYLQ